MSPATVMPLPLPVGLPAVYLYAADINDRGQIVGQAVVYDTVPYSLKALLWETMPAITAPVVLETALDETSGIGWTSLEFARAINNTGQIGGWGKGPSGNYEFFRLTPITLPALLASSPSSLTFRANPGAPNPTPQIITIANTGNGTMNWTVTSSASWLTASPASGSGSGAVTVGVNTAGLTPESTYYANLTITSPEATNSPISASVTLKYGTPSLYLSNAGSTIYLNIPVVGGDKTQAFSISNPGLGELYWTAASNANWLTLTPTSERGDGWSIMHASAAGLAAGKYYATVTVSDPAAWNNPVVVPVELVISPRPEPCACLCRKQALRRNAGAPTLAGGCHRHPVSTVDGSPLCRVPDESRFGEPGRERAA